MTMSDENGQSSGGFLTNAYLVGRVTGYNPLGLPGLGTEGSTTSSGGAKPASSGAYGGSTTSDYDDLPAKPKAPLTKGQIRRRRIAVIAGVGLFGAVLATDNNNLLRMFENVPLVKQSVRQITQPGVAKLGTTSEISFADQDHPYVVASKNACLYEFANPKSKTDICFDQGHKILGAVVQPQGDFATQKPTWLAVQVRHGDSIVGNAYMALRDLRAETTPEATVPAATAADYEVYLKKPPAKAGVAKPHKPTPGG